MSQSRRNFLGTATAATVGVTLLPYAALAAAHANHTFKTQNGADIVVHPISHASFVLQTPIGTVFVDPVGNPERFLEFGTPDLILITHEHGDHFMPALLVTVAEPKTQILTNPRVFDKLPKELKENAAAIENGGSATYDGLVIGAIPAYNTTEGREKFHPKGRDNGYVLHIDGFRIYISGDTEDIPEMRALENIDLAFVCMNLPFTMDVNAAASAVAEFAPKYVYPYHFRGKDGGTQDPAAFAELVGAPSTVKIADWY